MFKSGFCAEFLGTRAASRTILTVFPRSRGRYSSKNLVLYLLFRLITNTLTYFICYIPFSHINNEQSRPPALTTGICAMCRPRRRKLKDIIIMKAGWICHRQVLPRAVEDIAAVLMLFAFSDDDKIKLEHS